MSRSVARLRAMRCAGQTRIATASATSPQRWNLAQTSRDGWANVTHQLMGDGVLGGSVSRTSIHVAPEAAVVVRGVTATALRSGTASLAATRITVAPGGGLIYLPGALVPHHSSGHAGTLRIDTGGTANVLAASTLVPGRTAMGESGSFSSLRLRTSWFHEGFLQFLEDAEPLSGELSGKASFGESEGFVSMLAAGTWAPAMSDWWRQFDPVEGLVGVSQLREMGVAVRALFSTLGAADRFLREVECAARTLPTSAH
ncbi:MAG: urease accessory protein UreD [bacterium]